MGSLWKSIDWSEKGKSHAVFLKEELLSVYYQYDSEGLIHLFIDI
jgi:hypothetical protein